MADNESIVKIKTEGDTSGAENVEKAVDKIGDAAEKSAEKTEKAAEKAEKAIERTGDAAENAAKNTDRASKNAADASALSANRAAGAWDRFAGTVGKCKSVIGTFMGALGVVGLAIQGVQLAISAFQKLKDWLDRDQRAAEELARKIQDEKNAAAVEASAKSYDRLKERISEVLRIEQERDRLADRRLSQERAIEDAKTELEMQQELAGLDRNDPDYRQNAALVRSKYERIRADRAAERAERDNRAAQARRYQQADEKEKAAGEIEKDVYGRSGDAVISLKKQISGEKAPERRKELEALLDKLLDDQRKKLAEIKKLRDEAASLRREAENELGAHTAGRIAAQAVNVAQDSADADTRREMEQNRKAREKEAQKKAKAEAQKAADEKTVAEGSERLSQYGMEAETEQARAQAAAARYEAEQADVFTAQNRYDMVVARGGSRKERSAALEALQKEKDEALEAQHEMEKVAAEVANALKTINANVSKLSQAVKSAQNRLAQNQTDAPEG